jgi:hypothetical protein
MLTSTAVGNKLLLESNNNKIKDIFGVLKVRASSKANDLSTFN